MIYELSYIEDFCWCTKLVLDLNPHGNNVMQLGGVKIYIFAIYQHATVGTWVRKSLLRGS